MNPIIDALLGGTSPIGQIVNKILSFIPDPQKKAEAEKAWLDEVDRHSEVILTSLAASDQKQAETNTEEAKSSNLFIAGWRPFIGWTCGTAFAWAFVIQPFLTFILAAIGHPILNLPTLTVSEMMPVLLGMLGLGGLRSWEKSQGVQNVH